MSSLRVEVAYANEATQRLYALELPVGTNLRQAIEQSGVLTDFPEIDLTQHTVGVWAKKQPLDTVLNEGDRVEIYRPLHLSPTEARKLRAERAK